MDNIELISMDGNLAKVRVSRPGRPPVPMNLIVVTSGDKPA